MNNFVIITPAKNEEKNIEKTILSMIGQSMPPDQWVIVSDGSTDRTDQIVKEYAKKHPFIIYTRNESPAQKNFSSKVNAFNLGWKQLKVSDYEYIGNIDADISFDETYFEQILGYYDKNEKLGIAGGLVHERHNGKVKPMMVSLSSVAGAVQLFRRECFEQIGGYIPVKMGGIDAAAEISARAKGWETETIPQLKVIHHGPMLTGKGNPLHTRFQMGYSHYTLGYHPVFHLFRCIYRISEPPFFIGALSYLCGYLTAAYKRAEIMLPAETIHFLQKEQLGRLAGILLRNKA